MTANFLDLATLGLGLVLVLQLTSGAQSQCIRIKAGFQLDERMQLIIGDQMVTVDNDNIVEATAPVSVLGFNHNITAAVGIDYYKEFYLYSDNYEESFTGIAQPSEILIISYSDIVAAFADEPNFKGIDAGVEMNGEVYYFAGCSYVTLNADRPTLVYDMEDISELNLPCNVDAALYSPVFGTHVVIKGNQVWKFCYSAFLGPFDIKDIFWGLRDYTFCDA